MRPGKDTNGYRQDKDGQFLLNFGRPVILPEPTPKRNGSGGYDITETEFLTPQDLWQMSRIPISTQKVYRWQTRHNKPGNPHIPYVKVRRRVLYPKRAILAWIYSQQVEGPPTGSHEKED